MRILFAPLNISGQALAMANAMNKLGHHAEAWTFGSSPFSIQATRTFDRERLNADPEYRWGMLDQAIRGFDVFHLMAGRSLIDGPEDAMPALWDLPLLKMMGKKVIMHYRGSEVRLPSLHKQRESESYFHHIKKLPDEEVMTGRVEIARRFVDSLLVSTPGLLDYVPDAEWVGHVVDTDALLPPERQPEPDIPTVLHIPSNPVIKGSDSVDSALAPLSKSGAIKYRRLEGITTKEVHAAVRKADILIDSLRIGDHGLISVEAMALGCIPVCHIDDVNRRRNPGIPIIEASVDSLSAAIAELASKPDLRTTLKREMRVWVEAHHSEDAIARKLEAIYQRPPLRPSLGHPMWPALPTLSQTAQLQQQLSEYRQEGHPLFAGFGPPDKTTPPLLTERLIQHIVDLESYVVELGGSVEHPVAGGWIRQFRPSLRDRLFRYPRLHLGVRKALKSRKK